MTNPIRYEAPRRGAFLLGVSALSLVALPALALDTSTYDLGTLDLTGPSSVDDGQGLCPPAVTVDGIGISYTCYQSYGNIIDKGAWNGKTMTLHGPWKVKCSNGVERNIGGGSVSLTVAPGDAQSMVVVDGPACTGRNLVQFSRKTAPYGDGTHFYFQAY